MSSSKPETSRSASRLASPVLLGLVLILPLAVSGPVLAQASSAAEPIGKAETIENRVNGQKGSEPRPLAVTDPVHRDERISTEEKAQAHLRFKDESDLRLGPKAAIKLDAFVYSGKQGAAMELTSGAMRFVSGNGPKGSYMIRTPVATIGLRGTTVEVTVAGNRTFVSLHEGAAQVCTRTGRCMDLTNACTYVSIDNRGVTLPQRLTSRLPVYSAQCSGDFCVVDRCTPQVKGQGGAATPPAATPPRATPPRKQPPRTQRPRRVMVEEEIIIDEPVYRRPYNPGLAPIIPVLPGLIIGPGRPSRPMTPGFRPRSPTMSPNGFRGGQIR